MASAVETTGTVAALADLPEGRRLLTLAGPDLARLAAPGRFAMLGPAAGWEPYLRQALPFLRCGQETVSFLFQDDDPRLAWLAGRRLGDGVSLLGPLGQGFALQPTARRLLLVALGAEVAPLLALGELALAESLSVSLLADGTIGKGLASIIPDAIELITPSPAGPGEPSPTAWDHLAGLLTWADQVAAAGPPEALQRLAGLGPRQVDVVSCSATSKDRSPAAWAGVARASWRPGAGPVEPARAGRCFAWPS